ncbi:MAG: hypothetical protein Q7N50_10580, partial [Armatimonadota bacterium]|nr:hypothetical protein [Armatimonadota bacterium]
MGSTFEIQLRRDDGQQIGIIDRFSLLQYALLTNDISACRIDLPGDFDKTLLAADRRLDIWRQPDGGSLSREGIWFIRKIKDSTDANGERNIKVTGYSPNYLLGSRIVAYAAASAQADKTAAFDNMMKAVVSQNLSTGATNTARTISTTYLSIAPNYTAAPSDNKAFAWRNVLAVLKDIADASRGAGTKLYFDMVPVDSTKFEFRTYTGQPGLDHTFPSG